MKQDEGSQLITTPLLPLDIYKRFSSGFQTIASEETQRFESIVFDWRRCVDAPYPDGFSDWKNRSKGEVYPALREMSRIASRKILAACSDVGYIPSEKQLMNDAILVISERVAIGLKKLRWFYAASSAHKERVIEASQQFTKEVCAPWLRIGFQSYVQQKSRDKRISDRDKFWKISGWVWAVLAPIAITPILSHWSDIVHWFGNLFHSVAESSTSFSRASR